MSQCSCGSACCSCPQITINELPKGEQVVTTIKREDIPKPPSKPKDPPIWPIILIVLVIWMLGVILQEENEIPLLPDDHIPNLPAPYPKYPPCPIPPRIPRPLPKYPGPVDPCYGPLDYHP